MSNKQPMISKENRPTVIDYEKPVADYKLKDLLNVVQTHLELGKTLENPIKELKENFKNEYPGKEQHFKEAFKESIKPEVYKPEGLKPEGLKPEFKPESKPEFKPENKPDGIELESQFIDKVSGAVVKQLETQGYLKR